MLKRTTAMLTLVVACSAVAATDAAAQKRDDRGRDKWVELGCQSVTFLARDRDTIQVGRREGRFKAIRLRARGSDVEVLDLKVVYANGAPDDITVRRLIRAGAQTAAFDLKGRERALDRIEMVYKARPSFRGRATVCAEGLG